ncbi:MAG TPA: PQQ-dependent sugar dehydrogenase, partial [Polyangia bacterium]
MRPARLFAALVMLVAVGCHDNDGSVPDMGSHPPPNVTPLAKCVAPPRPSNDATVALVPAFPSLPALSVPVGIAQAPGDPDSFYIWQQSGALVRIAAADPSTTSTVIDLSATANKLSYGSGENGFLGVAFSPNWATNHTAYLSYDTPSSAAAGFDSVLSRIESNDGGATFDLATEKVLLQFAQPYTNHNGGNVLFGPDGYLYIAFGDGGSGGDPQNRAQDTTLPFGKFLRLDVEGQTTYAVPPSNPFAASANAYTQLIYAYGVRNPWRWSFDRGSGQLWLGDVGQDLYEEVDKINLGGNYGWNIMEGTHCYTAATCSLPGALPPELDYGHPATGQTDGGACVTGGYVYRGQAIPSLVGSYLFADYIAGHIWRLVYDANGAGQKQVLVETGKNISSFGEGADGEIYVVSYAEGIIYKLVDATTQPGTTSFPETLSATGCVDPMDPTEPAANLLAYDVNMPLWSDGATKRRWLSLPDGGQIHINADGDWDLPIGTVLMKEFSVGGTRVETRLLVHHDDGDWAGYSYEWLPDGSDAVLLPSSQTRDLGNGMSWYYPSRNDCLQCHTTAAGRSLGLETAQMNRDAPDGSGNQMQLYDAAGLFDVPLPPPPAMLAAFPALDDATAPVGDRARAYLHANCSFCHRMGGPAKVPPDWRDALTLAQTGACGATPQDGDLGVTGALVVAPGTPASSVTSLRM